MRASIGKLIACSAIVAGLGGMGMPTAQAGLTLVITVTDANGTATETINYSVATSVAPAMFSTATPNSGGILTGTSSVFNDFTINVSAFSNAPGNSTSAKTTDSTSNIDYNNASTTGGTSGTVSIGVYPSDFTSPGTIATPEFVSSKFTVNSGSFNSDTFVTYLAQSTGTFTPGFQSVSPNTGGTSSIYSPFIRSSPTYRLYNMATFNLPEDTSGDSTNAVAFQGTSTVKLVSAGPPGGTSTTPIPTPEPATLAMALAGLPVVGLIVWRRKRAAGLARG